MQNTQKCNNTVFIVQYLFSFLIMAHLKNTWRDTNTHNKKSEIHQLSEILLSHNTQNFVIIQRGKRWVFLCVFIFCKTLLLYTEKQSSFKHAWNRAIVYIVYTWIAYMYPNHVIYSVRVCLCMRSSLCVYVRVCMMFVPQKV